VRAGGWEAGRLGGGEAGKLGGWEAISKSEVGMRNAERRGRTAEAGSLKVKG